ncbi:U2 small nuclear ribonucleoprotein auxiliary factor 35 kDa subunit-related protein 2 [Chelonus insularis]|uniref:U2 small nuclear ribonucleoprotein auxiliary factor 35 kDa subunit-related protein 2 n=1 Tax=Chelonus insularis TaxID=460826 RepID=UPI00158CC70D|nr:U2 small nuclear ribonucleoprotein auxiliary factor 35 kDa subunit-related protein 2 [Chelonus insularis]
MNKKQSLSHKEWRRIAKKERRRRIRRKIAQERDADEDRLRATLEKSADYLNWVEEQERLNEEKEKKEHEENERRWIEAELKAQQEWKELQLRKMKARQEQLQQEEKIRKEFEAKQEAVRKKNEELKLKQEEELRRQEQIQREIDDYIDNGAKTPEALQVVIDSQPGKEICPFFSKTAACKYGDSCSRNHRRSALTKIIIIPGFYSHFSLEKNSAEYDTDIGLEFELVETRKHFREFYKDVVPELESYGKIKTLKCCCNSEVHLRGNLYVEYYDKRDAARAWRQLKGRWYAGRQLNCEFANFKSWRNAVCGMNKCPKGRSCNYLHTFTNYTADYDIKSPPRRSKNSERELTSSRRSKMSFDESIKSDFNYHRNWRWSESPEIERNNSPSYSQSWDRCTEDFREEHKQLDHYKRSNSQSSRSKNRKKYSRSPQSSRSSRSLSRSRSKKKKRRRSNENEHKDCSKKNSDTDKENGSNSKKIKSHEKLQNKSELITEDNSKKNVIVPNNELLQKLDDRSNEIIDMSRIKEMESQNNWDTTDSEEYNDDD